MHKSRVMMIGLDGFELSVAHRLMADGRLPALTRLQEMGASALLDHGPAKRTGLAWEHVSSGLSPEDADRWASVDFDPKSYGIVQPTTAMKPFAASLDCRTVVFDIPYFDLAEAPKVEGLVSWGAHDPGVAQSARPATLLDEIHARFGPYPALPWIYGFVWPSAERTAEMADSMIKAVQARAEISEWLFAERLPEWDLGLIVVSEFHSAIEALWHGIDPDHPLHKVPSSAEARRGIEGVYEAADRMIARLMERFPDVRFVVFNLHGMGANDSDVPSMVLLPELLYRHSFGKAFLKSRNWTTSDTGVPLLHESKSWGAELDPAYPPRTPLLQRAKRKLLRMLGGTSSQSPAKGIPIDWMPVTRYRRFWPKMKAFALPSFYDGRVRINLAGREQGGRIPAEAYEDACREIETLIGECTCAVSGKPVLGEIERPATPPMAFAPSHADISIIWKNAPLGFDHPRLGRIGPFPYRRTGGHTGDTGIAWFAGPGIRTGELGSRSAFDIVPTMIDLLGARYAGRLSGNSLYGDIAEPAREMAL